MKDSAIQPLLVSQWKYWGAGFAGPPCEGPVHLEQLLVETACQLEKNARLLVMAVSWLAEHFSIVDIEELVALAREQQGRDSASLGLMLEIAQGFIGSDVFAPVLSVCHPCDQPEPLSELDRSRPALARFAEQSAGSVSQKWGLWTQNLDVLKTDALRPASWIIRHNRTFLLRKLLKGDVRSKVIITLAEKGLKDVNETDLTHIAGCTRRTMHMALDNLEASGLIIRERKGRSYAINLSA